jgi:tetratricopeptide (TPR) repeat protein
LTEKILTSKSALEGERKAELEAMHWALDQASVGQSQLVAVIGEPGVGKTRLFYECLCSHRTPGWLLLESYAVSDGKATPHVPVRDLLKAYFQLEARDDGRHFSLGGLYLHKGDLHKAIPVLERSLGLCQVTNILTWFPTVAAALGYAYAVSGRVVEALPLLKEAVEQDASRGLSAGHARRVTYLSETCLRAGRMDEAAALALADELGMRPLAADCLLGLGTLYATIGQREQARAELSTAIALYRGMEMTSWLTRAEAALAQLEER